MKIHSIVLFVLLFLLPYLAVKGYDQFKDNLVDTGKRLALKATLTVENVQDQADKANEQMKSEIGHKTIKILFLIGQLEKAREKAVLRTIVHALYREEYELAVLLREKNPPTPKLIRIWLH